MGRDSPLAVDAPWDLHHLSEEGLIPHLASIGREVGGVDTSCAFWSRSWYHDFMSFFSALSGVIVSILYNYALLRFIPWRWIEVFASATVNVAVDFMVLIMCNTLFIGYLIVKKKASYAFIWAFVCGLLIILFLMFILIRLNLYLWWWFPGDKRIWRRDSLLPRWSSVEIFVFIVGGSPP